MKLFKNLLLEKGLISIFESIIIYYNTNNYKPTIPYNLYGDSKKYHNPV